MRHGALLDFGYDTGHILLLLKRKFIDKGGDKMVPNALFILYLLHHSLGMIILMPLNVNYPEFSLLAEGTFWVLGIAGGGVLLFSKYCSTLDVTNLNELR